MTLGSSPVSRRKLRHPATSSHPFGVPWSGTTATLSNICSIESLIKCLRRTRSLADVGSLVSPASRCPDGRSYQARSQVQRLGGSALLSAGWFSPACQWEHGQIFPGLEVLTKCEAGEAAPADDGAGEAEEGLVDVVADFPAGAQAAEPVQQRDRLFHDPAVGAQP